MPDQQHRPDHSSLPEPSAERFTPPDGRQPRVERRPEGLTQAETVADLRRRLDVALGQAEHLERALAHSRSIGAAIGILMTLHKVPQDTAFEALRAVSQVRNVKLHRVAERVVETGELS